MRSLLLVFLTGLAAQTIAQDAPSLETSYSPFDFDNYRRTPLQARQTSTSWASKSNQSMQGELIAGTRDGQESISARAAALFPDPKEINIVREPAPLPSPNELTDEITFENHGQTTKGQKDLLARARIADKLDFSSMSEADYELYVAQRRAEQERDLSRPEDNCLLRPMPTLINSKTGGPPHGYSVSQAGVGTRTQPRTNQNPFADLLSAFHMGNNVTKGNDPLPAPSARLTVAASTPTTTPTESASPSPANPPATSDQPSP